MHRVVAVVLAGGTGERLSFLSGADSKPAVPFGGKWRLIDFGLSKCVNRGIEDISPDAVPPALPRGPHRHGRAVGPRPAPQGWRRSCSPICRGIVGLVPGHHRRRAVHAARGRRGGRRGAVLIPPWPATISTRWTTGRSSRRTADRRRRDGRRADVPRGGVPHGHLLHGRRRPDRTGRRSRRPRSDLASMGVYVFDPAALDDWRPHRQRFRERRHATRPCWPAGRESSSTARGVLADIGDGRGLLGRQPRPGGARAPVRPVRSDVAPCQGRWSAPRPRSAPTPSPATRSSATAASSMASSSTGCCRRASTSTRARSSATRRAARHATSVRGRSSTPRSSTSSSRWERAR